MRATRATLLITAVLSLTGAGFWATANAADDGSMLMDMPRISWPSANTRGMQGVVDALDARQRALDRRERSVVSRETDLRQVEAQLEQRIVEVEALRNDLMTLLTEADAERDVKIYSLVKMLQSMRSKQGAAMLAELDDELAVEVIERMNASKAGKLLAGMDPERAARLAEKMAIAPLEAIEGQ